MVTRLPPLRTIASVRCPEGRAQSLDVSATGRPVDHGLPGLAGRFGVRDCRCPRCPAAPAAAALASFAAWASFREDGDASCCCSADDVLAEQLGGRQEAPLR
jgi:hypothetical protein